MTIFEAALARTIAARMTGAVSVVAGLLAFALLAAPAAAQGLKRIAAPAEPDAIALYDGSAASHEIWNTMGGQRIVRNVTRPTITPFLPAAGKATGAAVIISPGGAFLFESMDNEGWPVARWFADHGVAAFVLKYRTDTTPDSDAEFMAQMGARMAGASRGDAKTAPPIRQPLATADAQEALRVVRARSGEWGIDPARVGLLGFSAGAILSLEASLADGPDPRPAFLGYIYGPMTAVQAPANAPPMFAALAMDDPLFARSGFGIVESWKAARRPVELHVYERGGHGFGMGAKGSTASHWLEQFHAWLQARKLLAPAPAAKP